MTPAPGTPGSNHAPVSAGPTSGGSHTGRMLRHADYWWNLAQASEAKKAAAYAAYTRSGRRNKWALECAVLLAGDIQRRISNAIECTRFAFEGAQGLLPPLDLSGLIWSRAAAGEPITTHANQLRGAA